MLDTRVEDLRLPATVIGRIVKDALPTGAAVSKEGRTAIARAAAVFILNMTTYANDYAIAKKRKTVTSEDVYQAVKVIECEQIEKPLREAVELWKVLKTHKNDDTRKSRTNDKSSEDTEEHEEDEEIDEDEESEELPDTVPVNQEVPVVGAEGDADHEEEDRD